MTSPPIARIILYVKDIPAVAGFYERFFNMTPLAGAAKGWLELAGQPFRRLHHRPPSSSQVAKERIGREDRLRRRQRRSLREGEGQGRAQIRRHSPPRWFSVCQRQRSRWKLNQHFQPRPLKAALTLVLVE